MSGRIVVAKSGQRTPRFTVLEGGYPIKFISKKSSGNKHCVVYALTYGGGLVLLHITNLHICMYKQVSQDMFHVEIDVKAECALSYLTQSSTKVFKKRVVKPSAGLSPPPEKAGLPNISSAADIGQSMHVNVSCHGCFSYYVDCSGILVYIDPATDNLL